MSEYWLLAPLVFVIYFTGYCAGRSHGSAVSLFANKAYAFSQIGGIASICAVLLLAGCASGGSYRDNVTYNDPYLMTPIDNDIYN